MEPVQVKSALFVDFGSVFQGLFDEDRDVARAFARQPDIWMARLRTAGLPDGTRRDFLIRRCYLNPDGAPRISRDPARGRDPLINYASFRPLFTRAGFEVIDCPNHTSAQQSGIDVRIALDVVDLVVGGTPCEEFVVASGDSDLTPLLHRLNARDRKTYVLSTGTVSAANRAAATMCLEAAEFTELIRPARRATDQPNEAASGAVAAVDAPSEPDPDETSMSESTTTASWYVPDDPDDALLALGLPVTAASIWHVFACTLAESIGASAPFFGLVTRTCRDLASTRGIDWSHDVIVEITHVCRRGGLPVEEPVVPSASKVLRSLVRGVIGDHLEAGRCFTDAAIIELEIRLGVAEADAGDPSTALVFLLPPSTPAVATELPPPDLAPQRR